MSTNYPGIDYGAGTNTNRDPETGIHYGVIPQREVSPEALEDVFHNGTDLDLEQFLSDVKKELRGALSDYFSDYKGTDKCTSKLDNAVERAFDAISSDLEYESTGDCTRYEYDKDGYRLQIASDGDIFVLKSPYYTFAQFCSPCAPGACYLTNPLTEPNDANKCFCLGGDWFNDDSPMPYPVYSMETGKLVQPA